MGIVHDQVNNSEFFPL